MKLTCANCLNEYDGSVFKDELGWHGVCPNCGASFPVTLPTAEFIMAFAEDSAPDFDHERFVNDIEEATALKSYYTFDTVEELVAAWCKKASDPDGMWYFIVYNGDTIVSGACDEGDEEYLADLEGWLAA